MCLFQSVRFKNGPPKWKELGSLGGFGLADEGHMFQSTSTAVGLLVMMYPILCKVKYETLHRIFAHRQIWIQLGFSVVVNWIVAPLFMVCRAQFVPLLVREYTLIRRSSG